MSRRVLTVAFAVLAALAFVKPAEAGNKTTTDSKVTIATTVDLLSPAMLAGKQLAPGTYEVKADDAKLTLKFKGKVVAEVPVQWKDEQGKAKYSAVVTEGDKITEFHFGGKTRFVQVAD
jgi:hypothetical protein